MCVCLCVCVCACGFVCEKFVCLYWAHLGAEKSAQLSEVSFRHSPGSGV